MNPRDWIYDLETYPNVFTAGFIHAVTGTLQMFEVSNRRNQLPELLQFLSALQRADCRMVGFNNRGFDYPILHYIMQRVGQYITVDDIYGKAQSIIDAPWNDRFNHVIWPNDQFITQIDLYLIHHFDNEAKRTSLKMLEFNMELDNISDLPYPPGTALTDDQIDVLIEYNIDDLNATLAFYRHTLPMISFREELSASMGKDMLSHNDTKIGKTYFIDELEKRLPGSCYEYVDGRRVMRQTIRPSIALADCVLPYVQFEQPNFQQVLAWFKAQTITETKGVFTDLSAFVDDFGYHFGTGGIHGSLEAADVHSDDEFVIYDWDVASYYPSLAIANKLFPAHLSENFCDIYLDVFNQRRQYPKASPQNAMLKLALNGVYGDSNNKYSPFYDPQYTMSITINGQLLLCMLAEQLIKIDRLQMIQINTDGLTVRLPRVAVPAMQAICEWWQDLTKLTLESAVYDRMVIRDVNSYLAIKDDGKVKRIGAYAHETAANNPATREVQWHKNHSALIVPKAAEAVIVHGADLTEFVTTWPHLHDFMLRTKVGRKDKLMIDDRELQRITRYYVAKRGGVMRKLSPPTEGYVVGQWKRASNLTNAFYEQVRAEIAHLPGEQDVTGHPWDARINTKNRSRYANRETKYHVGRVVQECNDFTTLDPSNIDFDYYIAEARKLTEFAK